MYKVQYWSLNDNSWVQHGVYSTRIMAMTELFFLESTHKLARIIHNGRIIAESEGSYELPY